MGSSALYASTGIFFAAAAAVGPVNAFGSIMQQAIPSAPAVIALLNAVTIWGTLLDAEPVHWNVQPSSVHASAIPFCVGVKNGSSSRG